MLLFKFKVYFSMVLIFVSEYMYWEIEFWVESFIHIKLCYFYVISYGRDTLPNLIETAHRMDI